MIGIRARSFLYFLAFYTAIAQPGLPACWAMAEPCEVHPHFGNAHVPHSHDYLIEMMQANAMVLLPLVALQSKLLISLLGSWTPLVDDPPPRLAISPL